MLDDDLLNGMGDAVLGIVSGGLCVFALTKLFAELDRDQPESPFTWLAVLVVAACPLFWFTAARPLSDMTGLAADLLALAYEGGPPDPDSVAARFASAVPAGEEGWVLGLMAQSPQPGVADVLDLLANHHPDRRLAREARKAARAQLKNRKALSHHALALPVINRNAGQFPP